MNRMGRVIVIGTLLGIGAVGLKLSEVPRGIRAAERAMNEADLVRAEAEWRAVLAAEPGRIEALYGLGWTLHLAGREDLARESFLQCIRVHPDSPLGYKGLGSVAMAEDNPPLARRRFAEALERAPDDLAILHSLALLEVAIGEGEPAVLAFDRLVALDARRAAFRQGRAEALILTNRAEEGMHDADEAVRLARDERERAQAWFTRARAVLAVSGGRVDSDDCAGSAPPVFAWLEEADRSLDEAEATGVPLPDLVATRRLIRQRRGFVDDKCPGARSTMGTQFPDG